MKKILSIIAVVAVMFSSCVNDLDTKPLNENDYTADKAYDDTEDSYLRGLAKIYSIFCSVGQGGPNGAADINVEDGGSSELIRMWWSLNEFSTDEVKCAWKDDSYVREMNFNTWTDSYNFAVFVVYNRFMLCATLVNEYLKQTTDGLLSGRGCDAELISKVHQFRDEARYIRAYMYWIGMDMYGNIPFVTEEDPIGAFMPPQKDRQFVFDYITTELKDLASTNSNLPEIGNAPYPRIDKGAVWGLLSRVYLNGAVYTGTAYWQEAMDAANEIIKSNRYGLATHYDELFRGDNGQNADARKEFIFAIDYNDNTRSYGGTRFLTCASVAADDLKNFYSGANDGWGGIRTNYEFVTRYFPDVTNPNYTAGTFTYTDKRAELFYIRDREENISDWTEFTQGWSLFKWHEMPSTFKGNEAAYGNSIAWSNVDYPLIRYAEILLNYAEASVRKGSVDAVALNAYNSIRNRAGYTTPVGSFSLNDIFEERTRELMWEGFRRIDLIRFDMYTSSTYRWPWKGGIYSGQGFGDHKKIFPIPIEDIAVNSNLVQNPGY